MDAETAGLYFAAAVGLASGMGAYLWARHRLRVADDLRAKGWVCVGWNFITGPVMLPRWVAEPTPLKCWCSACDLVAVNPIPTHMAVCPECGDKRCPRSDHHSNACGKTPNVGYIRQTRK